jgi:hypothetical protein
VRSSGAGLFARDEARGDEVFGRLTPLPRLNDGSMLQSLVLRATPSSCRLLSLLPPLNEETATSK